MSCNNLSASQLAIISAVFLVIGDVIGLIAAIAAQNEQQKSKDDQKKDIEDIMKFLQNKLDC